MVKYRFSISSKKPSTITNLSTGKTTSLNKTSRGTYKYNFNKGSSGSSSRKSSAGSSNQTSKKDVNEPRVDEKTDLKKKYGDFAPSNVITTKEGKKVYTSSSGQRFDTPEEAAAANVRLNTPQAFNKSSEVYKTKEAMEARQFVASTRASSGGKPEGYYIDPKTGRETSYLKGTAPSGAVFVGVPGSLDRLSKAKDIVESNLKKQRIRDIRSDLVSNFKQVSEKQRIKKQKVKEQKVELEPTKLTSFKDKPKGKKIKTISSGKALSQGAFGTVLQAEKQSLQPLTSKGVDLGLGARQFGLSVASIPALGGQLVGTGIAQLAGQKPVFKTNEKFFIKTTTGKDVLVEAKTPQKFVAETGEGLSLLGASLLKDPVGTTQKVGEGLVEEATTKPFSFAGEFVGFTGLQGLTTKGLKLAAKATSVGVGRPLLVGKELLKGKGFKEAISSTKGGNLGTVRTDVVSKLIGRKTIDLKDITSKKIASDFSKGKSQFLVEPSEKKLVQQIFKGKQAEFIKQRFPELKIKPGEAVVFTAEGVRPIGLKSTVTGRTVVDFSKFGAEPFGKFAASRTATGPFAFIDDPLRVAPAKLKVLPSIPGRTGKPSVTASIGQFKPLPTKGGIAQSIKRLGFDISKTSDDVQKAFFGKLSAGKSSRPIKLKVLRKQFGEKAVKKGLVKSDLEGYITQSTSRVFKKTVEEELNIAFGTKAKILGGLKSRFFGKSIVRLDGRRIKLDFQRLVGGTDDVTKGVTGNVGKSASLKGVSQVSKPVSEISVGPSFFVSGLSKAIKKRPSSKKPVSSKVSFKKSSLSSLLKSDVSSVSKSVSDASSFVSSSASDISGLSSSVSGSSNGKSGLSSFVSTSSTPGTSTTGTSTTGTSTTGTSTTGTSTTGTSTTGTNIFKKSLLKTPSKGKKVRAYDVFTRRSAKKGKSKIKPVRVDTGLPLNKALKKGLTTADQYTDRTVILKQKGTTTKKDIARPKNLLKKFRGPKSKKLKSKGRLVFVEKSKYAIDSIGEKRGIPFKGLLSQRRKKQTLNIKGLL